MAIPFIVTVIAILVGSYFLLEARENNLILDTAYQQARTVFKMLVITRQWVAEKREEIKPVPAVATKELAEYAKRLSDIRFHITSDKLVDPANAPDKFEKAAMKQFKKGAKEVYKIVETKNGRIYRYMAPLFINKACMSCHVYQGYHIGDFRGGISVSIPLAPIYNSVSKNRKILLGLIVTIGLLLLVLVKILITKLVLIPVAKLEKAATEISHGNYDIDIQIHSNDELGTLTKTLEKMSKKISLSQEELKNRIKEATGKLKAANEKLIEIATKKSELYSALAHDIRTPLAIITLGSENIKAKLNKTEDLEIIEAIKNNAMRLKILFEHLLEIERIESGIVKINIRKEEINAILGKEIDAMRLYAENSGISLKFISSSKKLYALVDKDKLSICLQNILSNAIKFSFSGTTIEIKSYYSERNNAVIEIIDHGIGIASGEIDKIFDKFYRTERAKNANRYGTGLGLTITKKFIDAMNGKIYISSEPEVGTNVKIVLQAV